MKKYSILAIGALLVLLSLGTMAYAAGEDGGMGAAESGAEGHMDQVNINTASVDELQSLPGIDEELAQNIIDYRDASGPFSSVDDLSNVEGFDSEKLDAIRDQITVGAAPETQPMEPGVGTDQPLGEPMPGESSPPAQY